MNQFNEKPTLKEINAYKKKLNWGDSPAIFQMAINSIGDMDGILSHGFDSAYKQMFNKNAWNLALLGSFKDDTGNVIVKTKPKISLHHFFSDQHYELHCFPIINGEEILTLQKGNPQCPFTTWVPETMQMLFRISSFVSFIAYNIQGGDKADLALIKFAFYRVEELIENLKQTFEVVEVKGLNIAEFYREICIKKYHFEESSLYNLQDD